MSPQMVLFRTDSGGAAEVRSRRTKMFAALRAGSVQGVVHTNPLGLPEAARLRDLLNRAAGSPVPPERFIVVGTHSS